MILVQQPTITSPIKDWVYVNPTAATGGDFRLAIWGEQNQLVPRKSQLLNKVLGMNGPVGENYQVTTTKWPCGTGIQINGDTIGINLHSPTIKNKNLPVGTTLRTITVNGRVTTKKLYAFRDNQTLTSSIHLKVNRATVFGGATAQVVSWIYLKDMVANAGLWCGMNVFDRRDIPADNVGWDKGTNTAMATSLAGDYNSIFAIPGNSNSIQHKSYNDFRYYEFTVGGKELTNRIQKLKSKFPDSKHTTDPNNYVVTGIILNPEMYIPPNNRFAYSHLSLSFKDFKLEQN